MPKSTVEIEADREHITERIKYLHRVFTDQRQCRERDKVTVIWMLRRNISMLLKLPLPDFTQLLSQQLDLCDMLDTFIASNIPDLVEDLHNYCLRLRRKDLEISQSTP
jgi:hypothetical protein